MKNKQKNPTKWLILFIGLFAMFAWLAIPALAQDDDNLGLVEDVPDAVIEEDAESTVEADAFGLGSQDYWAAAMEFSPDGLQRWEYQSFAFYAAPNGGQFRKQVELPWGARMTIFECFLYDNSGGFNGNVDLWRNTQVYFGTGRNNIELADLTTSGSGGYQWPFRNLNELTRFRNGSNRNFYYMSANMPPTTSVQLRGCRIFWHKVVRTGLPNPFDDIGFLSSRFQNAIKALAFSGITRGCDSNSYCPNAPVTRGQMAVFLAEALGLHYPY